VKGKNGMGKGNMCVGLKVRARVGVGVGGEWEPEGGLGLREMGIGNTSVWWGDGHQEHECE
jgi:hypothetical protein